MTQHLAVILPFLKTFREKISKISATTDAARGGAMVGPCLKQCGEMRMASWTASCNSAEIVFDGEGGTRTYLIARIRKRAELAISSENGVEIGGGSDGGLGYM